MKETAPATPSPRKTGWVLALTLIGALLAATLAPSGVELAAALVAACLVLWLSDVLPPFAPTLILLAVAPLVLRELPALRALRVVLGWAADPVLALFFGGFVIGAAARRHGIDARIAQWMVHRSRGSTTTFTLLLLVSTSLLSMWMSNVAAAAMMLAASRPVLSALHNERTRQRILVGIAMAANVAGIATPLGSGPNGLAIAALEERLRVTFGGWMLFGVPLTAGLVLLVFALVKPEPAELPLFRPQSEVTSAPAKVVMLLVGITVAAWLSEPLHGVPAPVVGLALAATLFATGLLHVSDLAEIDWSTLLLVAGGIVLGHLTEHTGILDTASALLSSAQLPAWVVRLALCSAAALLSALMSNTATAALLIPIAIAVDPSPHGAIVVAVATSLGVPFVISTPPNAMVIGEGAKGRDLLMPGLAIMLFGVPLVALTGPYVLALVLSAP